METTFFFRFFWKLIFNLHFYFIFFYQFTFLIFYNLIKFFCFIFNLIKILYIIFIFCLLLQIFKFLFCFFYIFNFYFRISLYFLDLEKIFFNFYLALILKKHCVQHLLKIFIFNICILLFTLFLEIKFLIDLFFNCLVLIFY